MSLKVASKYIKKVKRAYQTRYSSLKRLAEDLKMHRCTLSEFVNGKPISYSYFEEICQKLELDLEEISEFCTDDESLEVTLKVDPLEKRLLGYTGLSDNPDKSYEAEFLPPQTTPHVVFDLMLQIDFKEQYRLFKQVINSQRAAGFLIHGDVDCGQQFLVNRLWRLKPGWQNKSPIKIDVTHNAAYRSCERLWRQLYSWFHLLNHAQPSEVIDKICNRYQTEDVIFIFDKIDCMPSAILAAWIQEFWETLVEKVKDIKPKRETHLLMFIVDNCANICQSTVKLAEKLEHPDYPYIPLRLPLTSLFLADALDEWIDTATTFREVEFPNEFTSQVLLEHSNNGVPQYVYEEICKCWGISWEGVLAKWLI